MFFITVKTHLVISDEVNKATKQQYPEQFVLMIKGVCLQVSVDYEKRNYASTKQYSTIHNYS